MPFAVAMLNGHSRLREIISVFLRHGLRDGFLKKDAALELRRALEELGPTFVKLGQLLANRPDLLPENFCRELAKLQDDVQPEPLAQIKKTVEEELQGKIEEVFAEFQAEPLAAASTAQIHLARLPSGEQVAVKVQRAGISKIIQQDLMLLRQLVRLGRFAPYFAVLNMEEAIEELAFSTKQELDYLLEARNIKRFAENNKGVKYLRAPEVYELTTSKVLVMEYLAGIRLDRIQQLTAAGYDPEEIATKLVQNYCRQILEAGFFHADPHPGNIHIVDRKIVFLDFGLVGELSPPLRKYLKQFLLGIELEDLELLTNSVLGIGLWRGKVSPQKLTRDLGELYSDYAALPLEKLKLTELMGRIMKAARRNNLAMPREMVMLLRSLITLEGVVAKLAPALSSTQLVVPYTRQLLLTSWDPQANLSQGLTAAFRFSRAAFRLPEKLFKLLDDTLAGKLKLEMEHTNLTPVMAALSKMVNRIVFSLITSGLIIGSSMLANVDVGPKVYGLPALGSIGFLGAAILGLWLVISIMRSGRL